MLLEPEFATKAKRAQSTTTVVMLAPVTDPSPLLTVRLDRAVRLYVNGYAIGVTRANGCRKRKRPVRVYLQIVAAIVAQGEATPDEAGDCAPHGIGTAAATAAA